MSHYDDDDASSDDASSDDDAGSDDTATAATAATVVTEHGNRYMSGDGLHLQPVVWTELWHNHRWRGLLQ